MLGLVALPNTNPKIVAISGGFDPIHIGHIRYIHEAKKLGDCLIAILNTDEWLLNKKGFYCMPLEERFEILIALKDVDGIVIQIDTDNTVANTLRMIKPHIFAEGGDRHENNMPQLELDACKEINCEIVYGVGGDKISSSRDFIRKVRSPLLYPHVEYIT